jgi:hypothetical protein
MGSNNWGQINFNLVNQLGAEANGGFLMVEYHKSSAPISLCPQLIDQINVALTPIKLIFGAEADF